MLSLFDFSIIIKQHYEDLIVDSNKLTVIFVFFIIPSIISIIFVYFNFLLNKDIINSLLVAFTIFTAFLPNVIFIQLSIRKDLKDDKTFGKDAIKVSNYLYTNSVYSLLISVLILAVLIALLITNDMNHWGISLIVYVLVIHFLITFLMVIQRVFILFFPQDTDTKKEN